MTDKQCDRCGEVNPAEIHTCSPNYVDRRQWKYDPMTGEPLVDDWPLYSGLPEPEPAAWMYEYGTDHGDAVNQIFWHKNVRFDKPTGLARNVVPLYTAPPQREWQGLTDEEGYAIFEEARHGSDRPIGVLRGIRAIEAKLKEKNT